MSLCPKRLHVRATYLSVGVQSRVRSSLVEGQHQVGGVSRYHAKYSLDHTVSNLSRHLVIGHLMPGQISASISTAVNTSGEVVLILSSRRTKLKAIDTIDDTCLGLGVIYDLSKVYHLGGERM